MSKTGQLPRLRIIRLRPDEAVAALEWLHDLWHPTDNSVRARLVEQRTTAHFAKHTQRRAGTHWLAWMGAKLVGLSATTAKRMDDVWVKRRYRRRGIATRLFDSAGMGVAQRGFSAAKAGCEDFNHAASAMLENLGWRQIGAELGQIAPGVRHAALVYTRPLPLQEAS